MKATDLTFDPVNEYYRVTDEHGMLRGYVKRVSTFPDRAKWISCDATGAAILDKDGGAKWFSSRRQTAEALLEQA